MDDKKKVTIDQIMFMLQQMEQALINFAPLVASYYEALIKGGLPDDLARDLILDWHNVYWVETLNKTEL